MTEGLKQKLSDPVVKQALTYWVMFCINRMGQVKSARKIKLELAERLKNRVSPMGVDYIYNLALAEFHKREHANSQSN